jgi:hypothetical protein
MRRCRKLSRVRLLPSQARLEQLGAPMNPWLRPIPTSAVPHSGLAAT